MWGANTRMELEDSTFERDLSPVARLLAAHDIPDPPEVFLQGICSAVNKQDVARIKDSQLHMLQRFEKTNEMLQTFNVLSASRFATTAKDFKHHTQLLGDMKNDLGDIFKRIRSLKTQLSKQHPEAFQVHGQVASVLEEEEEEEEDEDTIAEDISSHTVAPSTSSDNSMNRPVPTIVEPTDSADNT